MCACTRSDLEIWVDERSLKVSPCAWSSIILHPEDTGEQQVPLEGVNLHPGREEISFPISLPTARQVLVVTSSQLIVTH